MDGDGSGKIELNELVKNMAFQVCNHLIAKFFHSLVFFYADSVEEESVSNK